MADTIKNPSNRVESSANGIFYALREKMVYENGRVKRFETEREAWEYLARCDLAGKIIH
jgi:hypothetical protein